MKKYMIFVLLLTIFYQVTASESYSEMMDVIRKYMSIKQHTPHDLTEYRAKVVVSQEGACGEIEEILELSDAGFKLFSKLTEAEKAKLPRIVIAMPGEFAMKFYHFNGCCSQKYITAERPTIQDLEQKSREIKF